MHLSLELILFFNTRVLVSLGFLCIPKLAGNNYHLRLPCKFDTLSASLLSQHFLSYIVVELGSHVCWFLLSSLTLVHLLFCLLFIYLLLWSLTSGFSLNLFSVHCRNGKSQKKLEQTRCKFIKKNFIFYLLVLRANTVL